MIFDIQLKSYTTCIPMSMLFIDTYKRNTFALHISINTTGN